MHREKPVSSVQEMYLKTLYRVRGRTEVARSRDRARHHHGLEVVQETSCDACAAAKTCQAVASAIAS